MTDNAEILAGREVKTTFAVIGGRARAVQYTEVDGQAVVEGCIVLGTVEEAERAVEAAKVEPGLLRPEAETFGSAILGQHLRWPNGELIYEIDPGLTAPERVHQAIDHWTSNTNIRFTVRDPANQNHRNHVLFVGGSGCSSRVGMVGGRQLLTLGPGCTRGNAIHEIGHALGLWHEQSRIDRDLHVRIIWSRIEQGMDHNFSQHIHDGIDVGRYDFGSIMHYPLTAFSSDGQPTMEVIGEAEGTIGQRDGLSAGDRETIRQLYP